MARKITVIIAFLSFIMVSCTNEFDCTDSQIQTSFISFTLSDIDTFVIRKFRANDSYQTLLDTFMVTYGYSGQYHTFNDTTTVFVRDGKNGIRAGFDWQLFIPSKNKLVLISDIASEHKTGKCGNGIFSLDKFSCTCTNKIFSVRKDNQLIHFSTADTAKNSIYIQR